MPHDLNLSNHVRIGRYGLPEPARTKAPEANLLVLSQEGGRFHCRRNHGKPGGCELVYPMIPFAYAATR